MVLDDNENEPGWYVVHTTFKIDDSHQLEAVLGLIESTLPWIVSNVSLSSRKLSGWEEVDDFL